MKQLEALRKDNPDHMFLAALNCLILVYAKMGDVVGAMRTFKAISNSFGLTQDINSYNAIIYRHVQNEQVKSDLQLVPTCALFIIVIIVLSRILEERSYNTIQRIGTCWH